MTRDQIKAIALARGFTERQQADGSKDLNGYVYAFADAMYAEGQRAMQDRAAARGQAVAGRARDAEGAGPAAEGRCSMTTTREEFEAWFSCGFPAPLKRNGDGYVFMAVQSAWDAWQAAHLAGQRAMQERAAELCEQFSLAVLESEWANGYAVALKDAACGIRALEVKP